MQCIAVFGYSVMSLAVMHRLRADHYAVQFMAQTEQELALVSALGISAQLLDFRNDSELYAAGIGSSIDILFCLFPTDSDNVFLTISARALAKDLTIIAVIDDPESADKLLAAGANKIIDPHEICGRKAHEMLTQADVSMVIDNTVFGQHDLNIAQIEIPAGSFLDQQLISGLQLNASRDLILLGVVDHAQASNMRLAVDEQSQVLHAGNMLVVLGSAGNIQALKEQLSSVATA